MKNIIEKIHKLYKMSAKLNLYISMCEVKNERIIKEIKDIEILLKDIIKLLKTDT